MRLSIVVRGNLKAWSFTVEGDAESLADWRADGLDVDEIVEEIPASRRVIERIRLDTEAPAN